MVAVLVSKRNQLGWRGLRGSVVVGEDEVWREKMSLVVEDDDQCWCKCSRRRRLISLLSRDGKSISRQERPPASQVDRGKNDAANRSLKPSQCRRPRPLAPGDFPTFQMTQMTTASCIQTATPTIAIMVANKTYPGSHGPIWSTTFAHSFSNTTASQSADKAAMTASNLR